MTKNYSLALVIIVALIAVGVSSLVTNYLDNNRFQAERTALNNKIENLQASLTAEQVDTSEKFTGCPNIPGKDKPLANSVKLGTAAYSKIESETKGEWDKVMTVKCYNDTYTAALGHYEAGYDHWGWFAWRKDTSSPWNVLVSLDGYDCGEYKQVPTEILSKFGKVTENPTCYDHST